MTDPTLIRVFGMQPGVTCLTLRDRDGKEEKLLIAVEKKQESDQVGVTTLSTHSRCRRLIKR
jgi:hypothetical protein